MPALPTSISFTDSAVTEAQFKTAITNQREFLAGLLNTTGNSIDALVTLGALGADTVSKTGAYTVIASDRGKVILCNGTFTLSLTAAATLADGFNFAVVNTGTGVITIDPSSAETIDGALTMTVAANSSVIVVCTGTAFNTFGNNGGVTLLGTLTTTSGTTQVLSGLSLASYKQLFISIDRVSHSNTASTYSFRFESLVASLALSNTSFLYGTITINLDHNGVFNSLLSDSTTSGVNSLQLGVGGRVGESGITTATTSLTFDWSTASTFDSGTIKVYGVK